MGVQPCRPVRRRARASRSLVLPVPFFPKMTVSGDRGRQRQGRAARRRQPSRRSARPRAHDGPVSELGSIARASHRVSRIRRRVRLTPSRPAMPTDGARPRALARTARRLGRCVIDAQTTKVSIDELGRRSVVPEVGPAGSRGVGLPDERASIPDRHIGVVRGIESPARSGTPAPLPLRVQSRLFRERWASAGSCTESAIPQGGAPPVAGHST
jgi:hypothetical protein